MATINYELSKANKQGKRCVTILVMQGQEKRRIPTPITVTSADLTDNGKISPRKSPKIFQTLNRKIQELQDKVIDIEMDCLGQTLDIDTLVQRILSHSTSVDFFTFADEWVSKNDMKGKKNYKTFLNSLERFRGVRQLPVESITYALLDDYCRSLADKPRAQSMYMGCFRHLHKQLRLRFDNIPNPFEKFKVPKQQLKGQRAVDMDMLRKVFAFHGEGRAQLARDCAILSLCLMGMNTADMFNAKIYKDGKICYNRTKTMNRRQDKAYIEVVVPEQIQELFAKYRGKKNVFCFSERYKIAPDFNRAVNIGLKQIDSSLQFYQFRHTWATIARNDLGIDYYTVGAALNHVNREDNITDIYIKKDYTIINEANKKVVDYIYNNV